MCATKALLALVLVSPSGASPEGPAPAPAPDYRPDPAHRKLQVTGAALVGVGVGGFLTMVVGLALRASARDELSRPSASSGELDARARERLETREKTGTGLAIGGGVLAGAGVAAGVTTMAIGYGRARRHYEAHLGPQTQLELVPGPTRLGAGLRLRF